jgi:TonB family protein
MESNRARNGTLGLKRSYQKNLAVGFGVSGAMHITALVALTLFVYQAKDIATGPIEVNTVMDTLFIVPPPIRPTEAPEWIKTPQGKLPVESDVFIAVEDSIAPVEVNVLDQNELSLLTRDTPVSDLGGGIEIDVEKVLEKLVPPPETFTPFDEPPMQVSAVMPVYPELAQRTGLEGHVWVKAYVDKEGKVLDVIITKASPPDVGFEEAAIESARQTVWRPAISNGLPIGVWITYKVEFRLR